MKVTKSRYLPDWYSQQGTATDRTLITGLGGSPIFQDQSRSSYFPRSGKPPGSQVTVSENHPDWGRSYKKGSFSGDMGGEFFSQRSYVGIYDPSHQLLTGTRIPGDGTKTTYKYRGVITCLPPHTMALPSLPSKDLIAMGTTAIARCNPTNHIAQLSTFLSELYHDGLPKFIGSAAWEARTLSARVAGEEYLNQEFGWKPLVSDVHDIVHAVTHAHSVLEQYERGSGRMTRRRYMFPVEESITRTYIGDGNGVTPLTNTAMFDSSLPLGKVYKITKSWRQVWFSGAFTYHLPTGYHSRNKLVELAGKADALLGLDITPEVLWNLAPWSWAVDWFSNAGDVIANLSAWATDGLVMKYGYIMEHSFISDLYYMDGNGQYQTRSAYVSPVVAWVETKRRLPATPFGFGLNWGGLSLRQKAIAAALGLTHR